MGQLPNSRLLPALLGFLAEPLGRPASGSSVPPRASLRGLLLALVLHAPHLVPVGVLLQVALAAAARAEAEGQVVALLGPHVLPALLLVPGARSADAVELDQDGALPLVEALQVHPVAVGAELAVAQHPLVVVLLQVDGSAQAAAQGRRTLTLWGGKGREGQRWKECSHSMPYDIDSSSASFYRASSA